MEHPRKPGNQKKVPTTDTKKSCAFDHHRGDPYHPFSPLLSLWKSFPSASQDTPRVKARRGNEKNKPDFSCAITQERKKNRKEE